MERHILVVFSEPVEGREEEYNDWYTGTHLDEIVATPGFVAAQRYRIADVDDAQDAPRRYLAIYEIDGDVDAARLALDAGRAGRVPTPDAMAPVRKRWWFTAVGDRVEAADGDSQSTVTP